MKKFIIALSALILLYLAYDTARYRLGWYIDLKPDEPVTAFMTTDTQSIYMDRGSGPEPFTVKGVNLGVGLPGEWATDYAIDRETYLRWFGQMQEMGANTVRVYITLHDDFYNAFYEYNTLREENGEEPLWLIHGVWVNDYVQNSHRDAYDKDFLDAFIEDGRTLVDVLHGNKKISLGRGTGSGFYNKDVSRWVIGYILGVEWEDVTVTYTNHKYPDLPPYQGTYLSATEDASAFESMLAQAGDRIIEYESRRYKSQRRLLQLADHRSVPLSGGYHDLFYEVRAGGCGAYPCGGRLSCRAIRFLSCLSLLSRLSQLYPQPRGDGPHAHLGRQGRHLSCGDRSRHAHRFRAAPIGLLR